MSLKRNLAFILTVLILLCSSLASCAHKGSREHIVYAMDTVITINIPDSDRCDEIFAGCDRILREQEDKLSRTRQTSEVSIFNSSVSGSEISVELYDILCVALNVSKATNGAFDVTCEPLTALWDITSNEPSVPGDDEINAVLDMVDHSTLTLTKNYLSKSNPETHIDLGGIGKGYTLGLITEYLKESGVIEGTVSFGGNIGLVGTKSNGEAWRVGIKDPDDTDSVVGYISTDGGYIAVSGDYERYFISDGVRYHHIIDPTTGYPADSGLRSVAVICDDPTLSDALSTALFVIGYENSLELYETGSFNFEAVFITDNDIKCTQGIEDNFTEIKN